MQYPLVVAHVRQSFDPRQHDPVEWRQVPDDLGATAEVIEVQPHAIGEPGRHVLLDAAEEAVIDDQRPPAGDRIT